MLTLCIFLSFSGARVLKQTYMLLQHNNAAAAVHRLFSSMPCRNITASPIPNVAPLAMGLLYCVDLVSWHTCVFCWCKQSRQVLTDKRCTTRMYRRHYDHDCLSSETVYV